MHAYDLLTAAGLIAGAFYLWNSPSLKDVSASQKLLAFFIAFWVQSIGSMIIPFMYHSLYLHEALWVDIWKRSPGRYFHSAALASIAFWVIWSAAKKRPSRPILDDLAITILIVSSIARIGCFLQGCCGGKAGAFPPQIYMFAMETALWVALLIFDRKKKQYDSQVFWLGVFGYSIYRFGIEFVRTNPIFWNGLTHAQVFSIFTLGLSGFFIYFHRNPARKITINPNHILSPADGTIIGVGQEIPDPFDNRAWPCVSIFLSIWDVHINRSPLEATVEAVSYKPGDFKLATDLKNFARNESNWLLLSAQGKKFVVRQIAGLLGRKIVCSSEKGDALKQGDVFGRILLGSGTQVYLPQGYKICVKMGDKVKAGITVMATKE